MGEICCLSLLILCTSPTVMHQVTIIITSWHYYLVITWWLELACLSQVTKWTRQMCASQLANERLYF